MGLLDILFKRSKTKANAQKASEKETAKKDEPLKQEKQPEKARRYHVSLNKDEQSDYYKMWRVRKEQSQKTIKHFKTQNEAISYAAKLAKEAKTTLVIHKKDGSIRKQHY